MISGNAALALVLVILAPVAGYPAILSAQAGAQVLTLRMAANVPTNSPWDLGLQRMTAEFDRASGGRVRIAFSPTARVATESDIIQKMRLGIDGALLTSYGLAELYSDSLALSMPSFIRNDKEFDAVLSAVAPLIKSKLGDRYVVLALSKGGWVRYFSKSPILYPSDLAKIRISLEPNQEKEIRLMQSVGARVVAGTTADFLLQINSNAVDVACVSPIFAATLWSQLRGRIAYMSSFKVAPFMGAIVFNKSSWDKVPAELRPRLERVIVEQAVKIGLDSAQLETEAIASLDGIRTPPEPVDATAKWAELTAHWRAGLVAEMFSADILETMDAALAKVRSAE
jgi:TRAP-type transport system periplasmic protein